ncbi:MAG: FAD-dependent monooxygenase [Prolixibacteraceae bacterium]
MPIQMGNDEKQTAVLIAGAGPAGLMMACQLAILETDFRIIDRKKLPAAYSGALIIHAPSQEILDEMGLLDPATKEGIPVHTLSLVFRGKKTIRLKLKDLTRDLGPFPNMLMLEQSKTEQLLIGFLQKYGRRVEWETEVTHFKENRDEIVTEVRATDGKTEMIRSQYLIAADGGSSMIRNNLKIPFIGKTRSFPLCITDCQANLDLPPNEICFCFSKEASAGFFPISRQRWRIDLTSPRLKKTKPGFENIESDFGSMVEMNIRIKNPDWFSIFRSHRRFAASFRSSRCFLIGDAAHVFSPVGARGMNSGWEDARNLAGKIASVSAGTADPALLDRYEKERKPPARKTAKVTDLLFILFASPRFPWKPIRLYLLPHAISLAFRSKIIRTLIFRAVSGIRYVRSHRIELNEKAGQPDMFDEKKFGFWQKWLYYSSILFAFFGIALALYGDNILFRPYFRMLAQIFWQQNTFPPQADHFRALVSGPLGGTIACAYIMLAFVARYPFKNRERWSRNAVVLAFGSWFILDSAVCLYYQVYFQVWAINMFSLLQKALPLIFTWKAFNHKRSATAP